jgi:glycine cleavage system H protein
MFPWVYGFQWSFGYVVFLGLFFTVAVIVASTVIMALWRTFSAMRQGRAAQVQWASSFHDLPPQERNCRHDLTGELAGRICERGFDCRECTMHSSLLARRAAAAPAEAAGVEEIFGMPVPLDRLYHRGHTWVKEEADGTVLVGLDEMGRRIVGQPDALEMPSPGTRLTANGAGFTLTRRGSRVRVLAPIDGTVVEVAAPGEAWLLRIRPEGKLDTSHLLRGREVQAWYLRELERLQMAMGLAEGGAPSLADGGVLVEDVAAACPAKQWDSLCGEMFLDL